MRPNPARGDENSRVNMSKCRVRLDFALLVSLYKSLGRWHTSYDDGRLRVFLSTYRYLSMLGNSPFGLSMFRIKIGQMSAWQWWSIDELLETRGG